MLHLWQRQSEIILKIYKNNFSPEKVSAQTACNQAANA